MTFNEIREILKVRIETEDDPTLNDEDIVKNLVHCF